MTLLLTAKCTYNMTYLIKLPHWQRSSCFYTYCFTFVRLGLWELSTGSSPCLVLGCSSSIQTMLLILCCKTGYVIRNFKETILTIWISSINTGYCLLFGLTGSTIRVFPLAYYENNLFHFIILNTCIC